MNYTNLQIVSNHQLTEDIFSMTVSAPGMAVLPGQFAMVYLPNGELLLPRPISICDAAHGQLRFVYQVVGAGTRVMSNMTPGGMVQILVPLGKGFFTTPKADGSVGGAVPCAPPTIGDAEDYIPYKPARTPLNKVALVGGGIGTPPLLLLAKTLKSQGSQIDAYLGFRNTPILTDEFKSTVDNLHIATDSGSVGHHGNVLEILQSQLTAYDEILSCGPRPMLNALAEFAAQRGIPCQISTEERMACGLGTCVGCVLSVRGSYVRICTEGPVFYADDLSH